MSEDRAVKILKAVACCSIIGLSCCECPMWEEYGVDKLGGKCHGWTEEDVIKAVRTLNGEKLSDE